MFPLLVAAPLMLPTTAAAPLMLNLMMVITTMFLMTFTLTMAVKHPDLFQPR